MKLALYRLKERIKNSLKKKPKDMVVFNEGFDTFKKTGETPKEAYFAFIRLYCKTNGKLFDAKHREIIKDNPPRKQENK
jgi:hypothetical protein